MRNVIPGHMRAITWMTCVIVAVTAGFSTRNLGAIGGSIILVLGFFLADQAVHLAQEDHSGPPPTWIERMLQKYMATSVVAGLVLVAVGAYLMTKPTFE